jgi:hypothetical protein
MAQKVGDLFDMDACLKPGHRSGVPQGVHTNVTQARHPNPNVLASPQVEVPSEKANLQNSIGKFSLSSPRSWRLL